jgi:hypothetical protein
MALAALGTEWTGQRSFANLPSFVSPDVRKQVETHQWFAEQVWIFAAVTAVLLLICIIRKEWFRMAFSLLALLASVAAGLWVGVTGHYGGALVYKHGVGTPIAVTEDAVKAPAALPVSTPKAARGSDAPEAAPRHAPTPPARTLQPYDEQDTGEPIEP